MFINIYIGSVILSAIAVWIIFRLEMKDEGEFTFAHFIELVMISTIPICNTLFAFLFIVVQICWYLDDKFDVEDIIGTIKD